MDTDGELGTTMSGEIVNKPEVCRIAKMQKLPIVAFASWRSCKLSQVFGAILERQHKCVPKDKAQRGRLFDYSWFAFLQDCTVSFFFKVLFLLYIVLFLNEVGQ